MNMPTVITVFVAMTLIYGSAGTNPAYLTEADTKITLDTPPEAAATAQDTAWNALAEVKPVDPSEDTTRSALADVKPADPSKDTKLSALAEVKAVDSIKDQNQTSARRQKRKEAKAAAKASTKPKLQQVASYSPASTAFAARQALDTYYEEAAVRLGVDNVTKAAHPHTQASALLDVDNVTESGPSSAEQAWVPRVVAPLREAVGTLQAPLRRAVATVAKQSAGAAALAAKQSAGKPAGLTLAGKAADAAAQRSAGIIEAFRANEVYKPLIGAALGALNAALHPLPMLQAPPGSNHSAVAKAVAEATTEASLPINGAEANGPKEAPLEKYPLNEKQIQTLEKSLIDGEVDGRKCKVTQDGSSTLDQLLSDPKVFAKHLMSSPPGLAHALAMGNQKWFAAIVTDDKCTSQGGNSFRKGESVTNTGLLKCLFGEASITDLLATGRP